MILCLDVGNSQVFGGAFVDGNLKLQFRRTSRGSASSDEFGLFLRAVLRENNLHPGEVTQISLCSVVPDVIHSLKNCCRKYFDLNPFILQPGVKTGLRIKYRNPVEVGADRIANAIGAMGLYPDQNLIIVDFGTATTFCAISKDKDYLGGSILAGLRISMEALESQTAKLPAVEILAPSEALGRSTVESIQAGLYFGTIGMVKELTQRLSLESFGEEKAVVIGTGGFASLFSSAKIYDVEVPDLVLMGLKQALEMNT